MADRYWVGGSGTWNTTSTTNWSATSGGAGGASVPTTADSVFFDQAGTYTVTMTGGLNCLNFNVSAGTVTYATGTSPTLTVAGSMSLITGTVWNSTGTITFSSTGVKGITSAGTTFACSMTITGAGGTFTLNDNLTLNSARTFTLTNGTVSLGTYVLSTGIFSSTNTNTRAINFGDGKIVLTGNTTGTIWDLGTSTSCTTSGTQLVEITGGGGSAVTKTISAGSTTSEANSVNFSILDGGGTNYTFTAGHNIKSLVIAPTSGGIVINNTGITIFGSFTNTDINGGTATFNAGTGALTFSATSGLRTITTDGAIFNQPFTVNAPGATYSLSDSLTTGSTRDFTVTAGNFNLNGFTLTAGAFVSTGTLARNINFSNDGQIIVTGNNATVFSVANATNYSTTGTPYIRSIYTGATGTRTFNAGFSLAQSVGYNISTTGTSGIVIGTTATDSFTITGNWGTLDLTGFTNTLNNANSFTLYGDLIIPASGGTLATAGVIYTITLSGPGSQTINTNGRSLPYSINLEAAGSYTLANNWSQTSSNSHTFELRTGTLNLSSYTLTTAGFFCTTTGVKNLNFDTGKISVINTATNTVFQISSSATNLTVTGTNPLVEFSGGGTSVTKTIVSNGLSEANSISMSFLDTSATVTYLITSTGTNTVRNILFNGTQTISNNAGMTVYGNWTHQTSGGTTTFTGGANAWTFAGTSGTKTITSPAGFSYDFPWTFNGVGGTWQIQNNITLGSTRTVTLTNGTLDLNNFIFTASILSSNNANTRSINFGTTGGFVLVGNNATILDFTTATNFTYAGSPYISSNYTGSTGTRTFNFGGTAGATVSNVLSVACTGTSGIVLGTTATDTVALTGGFNAVNLTGITNTLSNTLRTIYGNLTVPGTGGTITAGTNTTTLLTASLSTIDTNGRLLDFPITVGDSTGVGTFQLSSALTLGSTRTLTVAGGTLDLVSYTVTTGLFNSSNAITRTLAFGTGKIVLNTAATNTIWTTATVTGLTVTGTPLVECIGGGAAVTKTINTGVLSEANSISFSLLDTGGTPAYTFTASNVVRNLLVNGAQTVSNIAITIYGTFTHATTNGTTTFTAGANAWTFAATSGSNNINNIAGFTYDWPWTFNGAGGTWVLQNNLTIGATRAITLTNGTLDFNNKTLTGTNGITINGGTFTLNNTGGTTLSVTVPITHTTGTLNLGTNITTTSATGYTLTAGTLSLASNILTTPIFNTNTSNVRTLAFDTGKIVLNGSVTATIWVMSSPNMTVTGNALVECIGGGSAVTKTIQGAVLSEANSISFSLLETTGTVTYAFTASSTVKNLTVNGLQTISNIAITIFGNFLHQTTNGTTTFTAGTNAWTFAATGGTQTITTPAVTYDFPWTFNGVGGTWRLLSNVTLGSTRAFTLTNGTFDFNNFTVSGPTSGITINGGTVGIVNTAGTLSTALPITHTAGTLNLTQNLTTTSATGYTFTAGTLNLSTFTLTALTFSSNNSNTRTLNFGTGKIVLNASTTSTIWTTATVTGLTVAGIPVVECIGGGGTVTKTINTGSLSEANAISFSFLETSALVTYTFTAGSTFRNLIFNNNQVTISNTAITIFGSLIYSSGNGGTIFTGGTNAWTFANTGTTTANGFYGAYAQDLGNGIGTVNASSNFEFTGNFTIEGWIYSGNSSYNAGSQSFVELVNTATPARFALRWGFSAGKQWEIFRNNNGPSDNLGGTLPNNQWTHIALVRSGSTISLYVNGVSTGTTITDSSTLGYSTYPLGIGYNGVVGAGAANAMQQAYVSNLRIVKGIAVYTGNFTVPTGPLTSTQSAGTNISAITGTETVLLTCQSSTLIDNSSYASTITSRSGSAISLWNPFNQNGTGVGRAISVGVTLDYPLTFNGVGGTWELDQNLAIGSTRAFTLSNGTFDFNTFAVSGPTSGVTINGGSVTISNSSGGTLTTALPFTHTAGALTLTPSVTSTSTSGYTLTAGTLVLGSNILTIPVFSSANSNTRSINFGTGKIVISAALTATVWNTSTTTGFSYTGTGLVEFAGSGGGGAFTQTINTGALTEAQSLNFSLLGTSGPTYTFTAGNAVRNLIVNGAQVISNIAITIFGGFTHQTTGGTTTFNAGANAWTFAATSGTQTITTPAVTYDFPWTFNGVGGTWQLQNNITLGSTRAFTLTNGTFNFNNFALSGPTSGITVLTGSSTITNTGGTFTTSLPFTHTSGTLTLAVNITTSSTSGYTLTAGTLVLSTFALTTPIFSSSNANTRSISFGTGKIVLNASTTSTIWNMATLTGFTVSGTPLVECIGGGTAVTKTINTGTATEAQSISFSLLETTGTVTYAFTASNAVRNLVVNGLQTLSNIAISIFGGYTYSNTNGTTTFTAGANAWTFASTNVTVRNITTTGVTYDFPWTFNGVGGNWLFVTGSTITLGATRVLTLTNGTVNFNSPNASFAGASGITIVTGSVGIQNLNTALAITHTSGTALMGTANTTGNYTLTAGTLNLNNFTLTAPLFSSSNANARTLAFGTSGSLSLTSFNTTIFDVTTATSFTTTGTPYIVSTYTGATGTRTFNTGFTEAQSAGYDVKTSGSSGIIIGTTATDIVALTGSYNNFDLTGLTNTISNTTRTLYGNFVVPATGGTLSSGSLQTIFASAGSRTITTNGRLISFGITINGTGTFTLQDNLTIQNQTLFLSLGTLALGANTLNIPAFSSSGTGVRSINFGTGQIILTGDHAFTSIWTTTTVTNFSFTGTSNIVTTVSAAVNRIIDTGTMTEAQSLNWSLQNTAGTITFTASNAVRNLTVNGSFTLANIAITIFGNYSYINGTLTSGANAWTFGATTGTQTLNSGGVAHAFPITKTGAGTLQLLTNNLTNSGNTFILSQGTLDLNNLILTVGLFISNTSTVRSINFGTISQIIVSGNGATVFNMANATGFTYTGTPIIYSNYNGATGTRTFDFGSSGGVTVSNIFNISIGTSGTGIVINAGTDSIALTGSYNNINLTGLTMTVTNTVTSVYGNLTIPSSGGSFTAGANAWTFPILSGTSLITTNGRTLDFPITIGTSTSTGTVQPTGAVTIGTTRALTVTGGTLDLNNFTVTAGTLSSTNSNLRTLAFGSTGQLALTGSTTTVVDMTIMTNFTETGTPYINSTGTGARSYIFGSSGGAFPDNVFNVSRTGTSGLVIGTGADSITLTGSFGDIDLTGFTGTLTNTARTVYGNLTFPASGGTFTAGTTVTTVSAPNTPVANGYSGYFNGTSSLITLPNNAAFTIGTNNFTIECWIYLNAIGQVNIIDMRNGTTAAVGITIYINTTNNSLRFYTGGADRITGQTMAINQWYHVALARSSGSTRMFVNGVQTGSTYADTNSYIANGPFVARFSDGASGFFNGMISNMRIVNGTALYTSDFTPPTSPLTAVANTSALILQSTSLVDNSTNNFTLTPTSVNISQASPFTGTLTTRTITTNGRTLDFPVTIGDLFSGPGTVQLADALTLGSTRTATLAVNTLNLNNLTFTANAFVSNTTANRTLDFSSSGQITLVGSGVTIWNSNVGINFNANGNRTVFSSYAAGVGTRTIDFGNISEPASFNLTWGSTAVSNNFTLSNAATDLIIIRGALNDWNQGSFSGSTANQLQNATRTIYGNTNISGGTSYGWFQGGANVTTFAPSGLRTINTNNFTPNIRMTMNGTGTLQLSGITRCDDLFTLAAGNIDLNGFFLGTWQFNSSGTSNRNVAFGTTGNSYIATGIANTVVINVSTATNFTWSGIAKINCGNNPSVTGTRTIALGNAAPFDPNFTLGIAFATVSTNADLVANSITIRNTSTDTITVLGQVRDFDLRTTNNIITNQAVTAYGNFYTSGSGGTLSAGTNTLTLAGYSGNFVVATASRQLDFPITFNGNGNYEITQTFTVGTGTTSTRTLSLLTGNITPNNVQINCGQFNSNSGNIRSINFTANNSRIVMWANNTTVWNSNNGANFSYTGNLDIESGFTGNTGTRTFDFGNIPEAFTFNVQVATAGNAFGLNTANDTVNLVGSMNSLDLTSFTGTLTNASKTVFGNLTIPATGGTYTAGTNPLTLASTSGTKTVDTANRALAFPITFNGVGGNWTLANGLNANTTTVLTLANGTVDFNQRSLVFANITIAGGATGNASLRNLSTTLAFVHANGTLNILSGAINSSTSNAYTLNSGTLNVSANFSTGAFTNNGGNVIL